MSIMYRRDFVTLGADRDLFSAALFEFMRRRSDEAPDDEPFVIVHSEPLGELQRHVAQFDSAEALAEFERFWREARGLGQVVRTLAA